MQVHNPAATDLCSQDGFCAFYAEALPKVYGYFYTRCGADKSTAEDLTQETFLAAAKEIKAGKIIEQPLPWIVGIARHKLLDHFRRARSVHLLVLAGDEDLDGRDAPALPEFDVGDREGILAALAAVASPQRDALILHFMDDLPVAEVALMLGRSRGATESLISRGRVAFRKHYLETNDDS
jgi:RNA polymerase sigma-70 factor (ECF subfamily)